MVSFASVQEKDMTNTEILHLFLENGEQTSKKSTGQWFYHPLKRRPYSKTSKKKNAA